MSTTRTGRSHSPEHRRAIGEGVRRRWKENPPRQRRSPTEERKARQVSKLRQRFGMEPEEYDRLMASQGGACAICGEPETHTHRLSGQVTDLSVDHDHNTGFVRGLLCRHCNLGLGHFRDDSELLRAAIVYLQKKD